MKKFLSIFLLLSFTVMGLWPALLFTNYFIFKAEITQKHCVNKEKPELKCDGKCYLRKQMIAVEAEQENNNNQASLPPVQPVFLPGLPEYNDLLFVASAINAHEPISDPSIPDWFLPPPDPPPPRG